MIISALRNGIRGALAATVVYPLAERLEKRDIRSKTAWIRTEIDRPFADRKRRAHERLVEMVRLAGHKVPYYRDLFATLGFDPEKVASDVRYLHDLPYLSKDIIREQGHRLLRDDREGLRIHTAKTGGSTGPSAHIYYDQAAADWSSAINRESRRRIGNSAWRSELHFASKFPEVFPWKARLREAVKCFAMNRDNVFFSTFGDDELESIWRQVRAIRPHLLHAHPSTVDQLAQYIERTRGSGRAFEIFESSGELLEQGQRQRIERALRCKVVDRYGLAEAGVLAYQLDVNVPQMRYFEFFAWPEVASSPDISLEADESDAQAGELVITPLSNTLMPLIRYRTGDNIVLAERQTGFEVMRMVGRIHDVVTISGVPLPTHYIQDVLDRVGGIREFQIEVRAGKPVFRLVPEPGVDTAGMTARIQSWWPEAVSVEFIEPRQLKLVGSRQKFRHLVQPHASEAAAKVIEILGSESDPAVPVVKAALRRTVTAGQIDAGSTGGSKIVVLVNPTDQHAARLAGLLREGGKAIIFGRLSSGIADLCGLKVRGDVPENWRAASECAPAPLHAESRSAAAVTWSSHPLAVSAPFKARPFLRFDFANEWNNLGYGRIRGDGGVWAIATDVVLAGADVLATAEADGLDPIPFVTLHEGESGAVLWWNRAVGPVDSGEWAVVEDFLANWRHADLPTVPVVSEIPFGFDVAITMRLDCDEDIASARPLFDLYRSRSLPFSLAVRTAQDDEGGQGAALLRDIVASRGAVLSHSVTHAPNWGGSEDACYLEARGSIDWLEEHVPGLRVRYAVSPFHQNPPYASAGLKRAGIDGFVGGIVANDPEAMLARAGVLPDDDTGVVTHSQQCMLHGDCVLPGSDGLRVAKEAFVAATASRSIFGFLDHPFSARYQYGWTSEDERLARHAEFLDFIAERTIGKNVLWLNEDHCLDWIASKARLTLRPDRDGYAAEGLEHAPHRFAVQWRGDVLPLDAIAHG